MKKFIWMLAMFLMIVPMAIFAQADPATPVGQIDFNSVFATFAGFGVGVVIITGLITTKLVNLSTTGRSIVSWVVAAVIGYAGWFLHLGIFNAIPWYQVLVIVVSFALGSNIIYNISWVRALLAAMKITTKKSDVKPTT